MPLPGPALRAAWRAWRPWPPHANNKQMVKKKDEQKGEPLQAVVFADSFTKTFRPLTIETPKVLLPLVNTPMLFYTVEFLAAAGVEEVVKRKPIRIIVLVC
mgnify:CR=1 FL=1